MSCIGLIKAINHFDVTQQIRFFTYDVPIIVGETRRYLGDSSTFRVSRSMRGIGYKALQAREQLSTRYQREPTAEQIDMFLDIPREDVVLTMEAVADPVSLYDSVYVNGSDPTQVKDQVSDGRTGDEGWIYRIV